MNKIFWIQNLNNIIHYQNLYLANLLYLTDKNNIIKLVMI